MSVILDKPGRRLPFFGWGRRMALPRGSRGVASAVPALVSAVPVRSVRAWSGRSRFVFSPLSLSLDQFLFLITAALLCFGLVMVQSADARVRGTHTNWLTTFENKNAIHAAIALGVMTLIWRFDYRLLIGRSLL